MQIVSIKSANGSTGPAMWTTVAAGIKGVTEETTTGVHRLYEMQKTGRLLFLSLIHI